VNRVVRSFRYVGFNGQYRDFDILLEYILSVCNFLQFEIDQNIVHKNCNKASPDRKSLIAKIVRMKESAGSKTNEKIGFTIAVIPIKIVTAKCIYYICIY